MFRCPYDGYWPLIDVGAAKVSNIGVPTLPDQYRVRASVHVPCCLTGSGDTDGVRSLGVQPLSFEQTEVRGIEYLGASVSACLGSEVLNVG